MLVFLFHHWILVCIFIILIFATAAGTAVLEAYIDFKGKPKEEMFWCTKHGYFRKQHCLPLFPELGGTAENSFICPTCYYQTVFTVPNKRLN
jgi:hypothetical protein